MNGIVFSLPDVSITLNDSFLCSFNADNDPGESSHGPPNSILIFFIFLSCNSIEDKVTNKVIDDIFVIVKLC